MVGDTKIMYVHPTLKTRGLKTMTKWLNAAKDASSSERPAHIRYSRYRNLELSVVILDRLGMGQVD